MLNLSAPPTVAATGSDTLTMVAADAVYNRMAVTVSSSGASDTQSTTVTGTLDARVAANPTSGATTALTLSGDNLSMSDMNFTLKLWIITVATLKISGMGGSVCTLTPPASVTPNSAGGTFAGSLQKLIINRGKVTGTANSDFSTSPIEGVGTGTGTITMTAGTATATHRNFQTTIVIPVDFTTAINTTPAATVRVKGNLKAASTIIMPLNDFIGWTDDHGVAGASFTAVVAAGAAPLGIAWASGWEASTPLAAMTPHMQSHAAILTLPATGTRAPLWFECSSDLTYGSWSPAAASAVSTGVNPLPVGTSGTVTVDLGSGPCRFVRLRVDSP